MMKSLTVPLKAVGKYRAAFDKAVVGAVAEVTTRTKGGEVEYEVAVGGEIIGLLATRAELFGPLSNGWQIVEARVAYAVPSESDRAAPSIRVTVHFADGPITAEERAWIDNYGVPTERIYGASVVGEQYYQNAIATCRVSDEVFVAKERGNPHDRNAVVVRSRDGDRIGYLPKADWLADAIIREGQSCEARIGWMGLGAKGFLQVSLDVALTPGPIATVEYREADDLRSAREDRFVQEAEAEVDEIRAAMAEAALSPPPPSSSSADALANAPSRRGFWARLFGE